MPACMRVVRPLKLLALYSAAPPTVVDRVHSHCLWRTCRLRRMRCHDIKGRKYRLDAYTDEATDLAARSVRRCV